jgi:hypothetical protein
MTRVFFSTLLYFTLLLSISSSSLLLFFLLYTHLNSTHDRFRVCFALLSLSSHLCIIEKEFFFISPFKTFTHKLAPFSENPLKMKKKVHTQMDKDFDDQINKR